jgi:hypothetical protein
MAWRTAASGYFFDSLELIAALAPAMGGVEALRGAFELLFSQRDRVNADMAWVTRLCEAAYQQPIEVPTGVDAYRALLTGRVFDIVNHWSYIPDIKQVNRLQAWFYAGFGLGRAEAVTRAIRLFERLHTIAGLREPLPQVPIHLGRMGAEAVRQMEVASQEDDLRNVRPFFEDSARRLQTACLLLQREPEAIVWSRALDDDLLAYADAARKIQLDLAPLVPRN